MTTTNAEAKKFQEQMDKLKNKKTKKRRKKLNPYETYLKIEEDLSYIFRGDKE
tara:strand:+ start:660 stop:818 length:159 start_codon:yes stop_codon:yes gene_type:complete